MTEMRNAYKILVKKPDEKGRWKTLCVSESTGPQQQKM
jgi:hypothetical protein